MFFSLFDHKFHLCHDLNHLYSSNSRSSFSRSRAIPAACVRLTFFRLPNSTRTPQRAGRKTPKTGIHSLLFAHYQVCSNDGFLCYLQRWITFHQQVSVFCQSTIQFTHFHYPPLHSSIVSQIVVMTKLMHSVHVFLHQSAQFGSPRSSPP